MTTDAPALGDALHTALAAADREYQKLSGDRAHLAKQLEEVDDRLVQLAQTRNQIRGLLGQEPATAVEPATDHAPTTNLDRVVAIVRAAAEPLRPADVHTAMRDAGWLDPEWQAPVQSVYGVLKRAKELGLVERN